MTFSGSIVSAVIALAVCGAAVTQPGVRIIPLAAVRIPDRLLPGDSTVVIRGAGEDVVYDPPLTARQQVQTLLADGFDTVVTVDAGSIDSQLSPEGFWIETHVASIVRRVLSVEVRAGATVRAGDRLNFTFGGGMLRIDGVTVQTEGAGAYVAGRTYLVFLRTADRSSALPAVAMPPLLVERTRLKAMEATHRTIATLSLRGVEAEVRKFQRQR